MRLIDADKLILSLNDNYLANSPTGNEPLAVQDCRKSVCEGLEIAMATVEDAPTVGGWISVEDRLPERSGEVFVYTENHYTASVSYSKKYNAFNWFDVLGEVRERDGGALWNVKYWMPIPPLPEPPKEDV